MTRAAPLILSRTPAILRPDPRRTVARLFVPGYEDLIHGRSRLDPVIERILGLDDEAAGDALAQVWRRFSGRHSDLRGLLDRHYAMVAHRLVGADELPTPTRLLIGAYFTHEYALEAAALFNPSIVAHPDQAGLGADELRVVLSLRAVGEGHRSSIEFRSGLLDADGGLRLDPASGAVDAGRRTAAPHDRAVFQRMMAEVGDDAEDAAFVLDALPDHVTPADLDGILATLRTHSLTRRSSGRTTEHLRWIAECNYQVTFPPGSSLDERALMPVAPTESQGMEDARFVRFTGDDGSAVYHATYTAYDGRTVRPQLITTDDFLDFRVSQLTGPAAANKGLALFPRPVGGRRLALSRWDRESTSLAESADGFRWEHSGPISVPRRAWELIQIGNCGSPVETPHGWLVLTHGVGPMRCYGIGAMLLDLDDPLKVLGELPVPLIEPTDDERDGYVPNVAYTCGALVHHDRLVVPYGSADSTVGIAVIDLPQLLDTLAG